MPSKSKQPQDKERPKLNVSREEASIRIKAQIDKGIEIKELEIPSEAAMKEAKDAYYRWEDFNFELLASIFDQDSVAEEYSYIGATTFAMYTQSLTEQKNELFNGVSISINRMKSILEKLELYTLVNESLSCKLQTDLTREEKDNPTTQRVFVVHGHDDSAKELVARTLDKFGVEPIILHEKPNRGRTIIEKFEDESEAAFVVVLLTPDDIAKVDRKEEECQSRARQNVIFEWGYFVGKLGRSRVCALYKQGVEIPSDYDGVLYTLMDDLGAWKLYLGREMKAAGLDIDLNKIV